MMTRRKVGRAMRTRMKGGRAMRTEMKGGRIHENEVSRDEGGRKLYARRLATRQGGEETWVKPRSSPDTVHSSTCSASRV